MRDWKTKERRREKQRSQAGCGMVLTFEDVKAVTMEINVDLQTNKLGYVLLILLKLEFPQ